MVQIRKCIEGYDLNGHEIVVGIYLDKWVGKTRNCFSVVWKTEKRMPKGGKPNLFTRNY